MDDKDARDLVARVDALLMRIEELPERSERGLFAETLQGLLELYGEGLSRVVATVARGRGTDLVDEMAADEVVSHLLMLHGLHPVGVEGRVRAALDEVQPYLASHGGSVELLSVSGGVAHLRLEGSCKGCPSSTQTLRQTIDEAILRLAPDVVRIDAEGAVEPESKASPGFVPLTTLRVREKPTAAAPGVPASA